jgi:ABC-type Fe3+ transport system permease subunit
VALVKDVLREVFTGLARWPLLMGAAVCFTFAVYEEMVTDNNEIALAIAGTVVGCVLLGAWLVSYIVAGERKHYGQNAPRWKADDTPKDDE